MALIPKFLKYKKYKKGRISTSTNKQKSINFGHMSLKAIEPGRLTSRQVEAGRRFIKKKIKPFGGIIKSKIKLNVPVTSKPISVRMGRGKGKVSFHTCPIKPGMVIYEIYCWLNICQINNKKKCFMELADSLHLQLIFTNINILEFQGHRVPLHSSADSVNNVRLNDTIQLNLGFFST